MPDQVRRGIRALMRFRPLLFWLAVGSALCAALLEGFGIMALLPLLELVQPRGTGVLGHAAAFVTRVAGPQKLLPSILLVFVVAIGLRSGMIAAREYLAARLRLGFADALRDRLLAAVCAADWVQIVGRERSTFTHALSEEITRVDQAIQSLILCIAAAFLILTQSGLALLLSSKLTLLVLAAAALGLRAAGRLLRRSAALGARISEVRRRLAAETSDTFDALKQIRSQALESRWFRNVSRRQRRLRTSMLRYVRATQTADVGFQLIAAVCLAAVLWFAIQELRFSVARISILVLLFARLVPNVAVITRASRQCLLAMPALGNVVGMIEELESCRGRESGGGYPLQAPWSVLRFEEIGFRYCDAGPYVLQNLDFTIRANTTTVLLGPSGAGKTTVIDLLIGLLRPSAGRILVDGLLLDDIDQLSWRKGLAYMAQDGILFNASIGANLTLGGADPGDEQLAKALDMTGAAAIVAAAARGMDTLVGDRGACLSGGERQRLALAQALLRQPALLILDEPTSALDPRSRALVNESLQQVHGKLTIVIATHDAELARLADQTLQLRATPPPPARAAASTSTAHAALD